MPDDDKLLKLRDAYLDLSKQFVALAGQVSQLRASVRVLKILAAHQTNPANPANALDVFRDAEALVLKHDPTEQERQYVAQIIQTLELAHKIGGGGEA